ncbi:hypothetical protein SAMN04487983_1003123 [Streptomyces sp. yr375]|uniref:hypothetical protein n=1 Tax=Streptomyces sp. yr375 TaxID=1761906 RepID=UPI0008BBC1AE|nr:hypothetical protein [Streptomyces sp. yr375]SEQ12445.1 hypothetical protein SAMN04487983_1003123 [Streptomyces sp. yr375]
MGRTAHFLSALAVAGAVLVAVGPAAFADPAAEVSPGSVAPGGRVTVSVTCGPLAAAVPESLDATSQAFADGTVKLSKVPGDDDAQAGPAYQGTAEIAPAADLEDSPLAAGPDAAWTVDGTCPAAPGAPAKPWSAPLDVARGETQPCTSAPGGGLPDLSAASCATARPCPQPQGAAPTRTDTCHTTQPCARPEPQPRAAASHEAGCSPATIDHGVQAGAGGTFTDSIPALAAGGLLIAGALAAAIHRLRHRTPPEDT